MARWALLLLRDHFLTFLGCGGGLDRQEALPSDWYGWDGHGTRPDGPGPILECGLPVPCLGWLFLWEPGGDSHLPGRTGRQGQRGVCLQFSGAVLCPGPHCRAVPGWLGFPARWSPELFGQTLFDQYPVFLPNLLFGVFATIVCIIGFIYLEETLPKSKLRWRKKEGLEGEGVGVDQDPEAASNADSVETADTDTADAGTAGKKCCYSLTVLQVILTFCGISGVVEAQNTLVVLLWQYPQSMDGFGFSPQQVSLVQVSGGLGPVLCHLTFLHPLVKKLGFLKVLLLGFLINSISYNLYPVYSLCSDPKYGVWRYIILGLAEFVGMIGTFMMFTAIFVFMNRASVGLNRATVNGWANSGRALSRAVSPLFATTLMRAAEALPHGIHMPFSVTTGCLALCLAISWTGLRKLDSA